MLREAGNGNVGAIALIVILAVVMFSGLSFSDGPFWMGGWLFPAVLSPFVAIWLANRGGTDHGVASTVAATNPWRMPPAGPADLCPRRHHVHDLRAVTDDPAGSRSPRERPARRRLRPCPYPDPSAHRRPLARSVVAPPRGAVGSAWLVPATAWAWCRRAH